jgi:AraC-like DNA-binding protein
VSHTVESGCEVRIHYGVEELLSPDRAEHIAGFARAGWQPYPDDAGRRLTAPRLGDGDAEGFTEVVRVADGLHAIITDWRGMASHRAVTWAETVGDQYGWLYIGVAGDGRLEVEGLGRARRRGPSCALTVAPPGATYLWRLAPDGLRRGVCIAFHARYIRRRYPDLLGQCSGTLGPWLADRETSLRDFEIPLLPVMSAATAGLLNLTLEGDFRQQFVASTAEQLLCLALSGLAIRQAPLRLSARDRKVLQEVRGVLDESLADEVTLEALARRFGINRNKLGFGFKDLFGMPVFEYVAARRMATAFELLSTGHYSVGEVSRRVGYSHLCNFTTAFRRRYGRTPSSISPDRDRHGMDGGRKRFSSRQPNLELLP